MINPIEGIKEHPLLSMGLFAVVIVGIYWFSSGGGGGSVATGDGVTAGVAAQNSADQLSAYMAQLNTSAAASAAHDASQIEMAKISARSAFDISSLQAGLGYAEISAGENVSSLQIKAAESAAQEETKRQATVANTNVQMQQLLTDVVNRQTDAQKSVYLEGQKPHSLFQLIFG